MESSITMNELQFSVNELEIHAQAWGDPDAPPVMAIHGWLDNSSSFFRLGPLLAERGHYVVALDLAGQGKSSFRSANGSYNIWDDLIDISAVVDQLGWSQHALIGHSRGAMMSVLYSAAMSKSINFLALIDGFVPLPHPPEAAPEQLAKYIRDQRFLLNQPSRQFNNMDELIAARCKKNGLSRDDCQPLVDRGTVLNEGNKYQWRIDSRAMGASAFKLSDGHCRAFIDMLNMPCDLFVAKQGMGQWNEFDQLLEYSKDKVNVHHIDAGHHLHMVEEHACAIVDRLIQRWCE